MTTRDQTDHLNRIATDVFWLQYGRTPDCEDEEGRARLDGIGESLCGGAPLPLWATLPAPTRPQLRVLP